MSERGRRTGNASELVVLLFSLLVVGGFVAVAVWMSGTAADSDIAGLEVTFDHEETIERNEGFFVPYAITNHTSSGIAAAEIWIEVFDGDRMVETAEIRVEFLAVESRQEGLYVSKFSPTEYEFRGRLESLLYP
jgi:uncharacterized protein (TIGR02588 family)